MSKAVRALETGGVPEQRIYSFRGLPCLPEVADRVETIRLDEEGRELMRSISEVAPEREATEADFLFRAVSRSLTPAERFDDRAAWRLGELRGARAGSVFEVREDAGQLRRYFEEKLPVEARTSERAELLSEIDWYAANWNEEIATLGNQRANALLEAQERVRSVAEAQALAAELERVIFPVGADPDDVAQTLRTWRLPETPEERLALFGQPQGAE